MPVLSHSVHGSSTILERASAGTNMQFSLHILMPLMQLLLSSATVTAVTGIESSGEGSIDSVLYPYTSVETQTDDPTTTATVKESESPAPSEYTTQDEVQLQTTTEQYAATSDASSATVVIPSTDAKLSSTLVQTNTEYGAATKVTIMSSTAGIQSELPTNIEASSTTDRYQTTTPSAMLSTVTEPESASTAESPATSGSQSTAELTPMLPTASEFGEQVSRSTEQFPTTDQFQSVSPEDSPTTKPSTIEYSGSLTIITPLTTEPLATAAFPTTAETTTENGAITRLSTINIDTKSSALLTSTLEKSQFVGTIAVSQTKTKPSPSTEVPPTADMFQTIAKSLTVTDSSAFIQPLTALSTESPSTTNEYLMTAEHAATTDHLTVTMASNNDQSESPTTKAVYSTSNTVIRAPLSPSIQHFITTTPRSSKGSITVPASSQSVSIARSPSVIDHQSSTMGLKFSTASYSYLSPTKTKYASILALVSSSAVESKSTPALKPHNVTQLELMTTAEFPISTDFPTTSKSSLSNADFKSRTVADSPASLKIQPTSTIAKTVISSTTLSLMNSARVNTESEPLMSMSTEGLHVHFMESPSVTPVQSLTIRDLSTTSKPVSFNILMPLVPQTTADASLATTTQESLIPTISMPFLTMLASNILTSPVPQATAAPSLATATLESPIPTISMPLSTMLGSNVLMPPVPQATADPSFATTTPESPFPTTSMPFLTMLTSTPMVPQATANPSFATTTLEPPTSSNSPVSTKFMELSGYGIITKSVSTMESVFPVESTTIPRISFESLQHHSITESPTPMKTSTTEFPLVAESSMPTNYHPTTTNYSPIFRESSTITESPITREFRSAIQYHSQVLSTAMSLDLRLTATNDALHVSSFPVMSELSIATISLTTSHPYSPHSLIPSRQISTEYLSTSSQAVPEFSNTSTGPLSQYTKSPLSALSSSPTVAKSEPATRYAASTETPTKSTNKAALFTPPHATVFPTSTKTESQSQSVNESPKITVNPSQLPFQTNIHFLTPTTSPTPASAMMFSDVTPQSNVNDPRVMTTKSPVNSKISATNAREVSKNRSTITVESIFINESPEPPPITELSNTVFLITSDQPYEIPITTSSTITPSATVIVGKGSFNATERITEALPTIVVGSVPTKAPSFITESLTTAASNAFPTASSLLISGSVTLTTNIENPLMTSKASTAAASTNGISPVDTVAASKHSLTLQAITETPSLFKLSTRSSTVIELSSTTTHQGLDRPTTAITASTSMNFQASRSMYAEVTLSTTATIIPSVTMGQSTVIIQSMNTADPTSESIVSPSSRPKLTTESSPITESPVFSKSIESTRITKSSSIGMLPATVITTIDSPTSFSVPVNLASTPAAESISSSEFPPVMESLAMTESHPIPSQATKASSTIDSMVDAIAPTMMAISSMRNESESMTPVQPMLSTKDPPRTSVTSRLLEIMATHTVTESQFMKSSIALKFATITDTLPTTTAADRSALTMTIDSPIVTPSQTTKFLTTTHSGTVEAFPTVIEATSIDLVTNDVPLPTLGYSTFAEPVATTNRLPFGESLSITDTHTTTPRMIKISSIYGSNQSSKQGTVTASIRVMPSIITKSVTPMQPMLNITPTAVTSSDSTTKSLTSPSPLRSTTVPEFGITINYLAITESLTTRESLAATESYAVTPPMTQVSTTSEGYQSLTSMFTVAYPSATVLPTETITLMLPMPSTAVTDPSPDVLSSTNLATTKSKHPEEIVTTPQFSMATVTEMHFTQSSGLDAAIVTKAISTTESLVVARSVTLDFPPSVSQTSREDLSILDSVSPTTTPTTLGVQATTDENSRLSQSMATSMIRSVTTSIANPNMATKSLRFPSSPSVTLEPRDTIGSSIPPLLLTTEYSSTSPATKTTTAISLTPSTTQNSITSSPQTLPSMIVPSATNINSVRETRMLIPTPVAEISTVTRYMSVTESSIVGDSSVAMKSPLIVSEITKVSSTSMAYQSTGSMFTAVSPSITALPSVTRKSIISMEPTPSATDTPPSLVFSTSLNLASIKSLTTNPMKTANETRITQFSALEATIITKSMSTTESHVLTPSVTLDLPPNMITSPPTVTANTSTSDSALLLTTMSTASVIQATTSDSSFIVATPTIRETERTVEASHVTVTTLVLLPSITESSASEPMLPKATIFTEIFMSSATESKTLSTPKSTITAMESLTLFSSKPKSTSMQSLHIITASPNPGTATESLTTKFLLTATEIQESTTIFFSSVGISTTNNTESQPIAVETNTAIIMITNSLTPSRSSSETLKSSDTIAPVPSIIPSLLTTEYTSTSPTMFITKAVVISLSPPTIEHSITPSVAPSAIVPSATISKPVSEAGLFTNASPVITGSPTIQSTAVDSSIKGLESTVKQETIESLNATESTMIMTKSLDATMLPIPTETLLPISTEQLTQSAIPTISPLMTLKSLTDSSVSIPLLASTEYPISMFPISTPNEPTVSELLVTTLRSITDSESATIPTQMVLTTSRRPGFTTVASSPILEPLPTTIKSLSITPKHSITVTLMTLAENLTTAVSTKLFPATSELLVATESDMQTIAVTKSQTSESPVSMAITNKLITATKSFSTTSSVISLPLTSREDPSIFDSMPPTTTPTTLGVQATTDENSRLSQSMATSMIRSVTISIANHSLVTKSLRLPSSPSVTLEPRDTIESSVPPLLLTTEYSSTSPATKTTAISLTPSTTQNSITSPPQTLIVPTITNTRSVLRETRILNSTPVAELSTATRYVSATESLIMGNPSVAMKSNPIVSKVLSTSLAYSSSGSAASPSITALPSVTRKSIISVEQTPNTPPSLVNSVSLYPATTESINPEEILTTSRLSTTKSISTIESHVATPSVTLDLPPTVFTSSLISTTNPSVSDSAFLPTTMPTASVIQATTGENSNIMATPTVIESEKTVEPSHATITTLPSVTELPTSDSTANIKSSAMGSKISATLKSTITAVESLNISSSKPKSISMPSLLTSPLIITASQNSGTATESSTIELFPTATEIQRPTTTFPTSSNIMESVARSTITSTESQVIAIENTMTTVTTKSLTLSILPSLTLESSDSIVSSILPSLLATEYSSISPITITTAAAISSSPSTILEYSITAPATLSSASVLVSESISETRLLTKASSVIAGSPTITTLQSMTVHTSTTESAENQKTIEPSNAIQSTFRSPVATMLPQSTETLLPITTEQLMSLTIMTTINSTRLEGESPTISGLLVTSTGSLNDTSTITVGSNIRLPSTSESSSLSFSKFAESSESYIVTSTIAESQTASIQTAHPSATILSQTRGSLSIIQSAIQTVSPSTTLKSLTDSSVFMVRAFRSVTDSESTTILTQTAPTTSNPPVFITVASSPILEPSPTMTKTLSITPKHSTAATLVTVAGSLSTAASTTLFPATSGFPVTSGMQTITVTKSQISESSVSLESMSKLIVVTRSLLTMPPTSKGPYVTTEATVSPLSTDKETHTVTESLLTIEHSSIKEYSSLSLEVTVHPIIATNSLTITSSMSMGPHITTEVSFSPLRSMTNSGFVRSTTVIKITNSLKPTPLQTKTPTVDLTVVSSLSTIESSLSTSLSPSKCSSF